MPKKSLSLFFRSEDKKKTFSLSDRFTNHLEFSLVTDRTTVTVEDAYRALALSVRDKLIRDWLNTQRLYSEHKSKKVFYLSMEFLMGRLLKDTLINLDYYNTCDDLLKDTDYSLDEIADVESDMGLGNGGLGRLASCFLDSMATLGLPAFGYGIRYEYGIFEQDIINGYQVERPDHWLSHGSPWEVARKKHTYRIQFYGRPATIEKDGKYVFDWVDTKDILATAYDVPVPGYKNGIVNTLRLWQANSTNEFDFHSFDKGDYVKAVEDKNRSESISKVLYPNDNTAFGKVLRLQQEYFFVSASLQDIIAHYKKQYHTFEQFPNKIAIQLNDTHPAVAVAELMRLLIDVEGLSWEQSWTICQNTFAYTNHTVLSEALEKWSVALFGEILPRHLQIINEINRRFIEEVRRSYSNDAGVIREMSIIEEGKEAMIRMAHLAIVGSHSVNGVSALHTEIIKDRVFRHFYNFTPEKFNNKTNGITPRRWLRKANPALSELITNHIGNGWEKDLYKLRSLEQFVNDETFRRKWHEAKIANKHKLIAHVQENYGIELDPNSLFDVQIKRLHEYKRQLLNVLHIITLYNRIKENPKGNYVPRTVLFGAKAAPGYAVAKLIIKLINDVAKVVNNDPEVSKYLKVLFLKNYSVSLAELIIPASDLSEQISTAGYEASGTGNMKFQLNGALTIGTLDGANVEMLEEVGDENIFIFGLKAHEVVELKRNYNPRQYYESNPYLKKAIDLISHNYFNPAEPNLYAPIVESLLNIDNFCLLADYQAYVKMQDEAAQLFYHHHDEWIKKSIYNVARSGKFSSDRTIMQYAEEIWNVTPVEGSPEDE